MDPRPLLLPTALLALAAGTPPARAALAPANPGDVDVEFHVRGTGFNAAGFVELYSHPRWDEPGCVFIRVPVSEKPAFASRGIGDIARHFSGHRVRARGRMEVLRLGDRLHPCLVVEDPARIERSDGVAAFTPTAAYERRDVRGFTLLLAPEVEIHSTERDAALSEMDRQLAAVCDTVPAARVEALRCARIWVEWAAKPRGAAEHHPSRDWLVAHGYNPDKAGNVEISNLRDFTAWSQKTQPCMLLHELAHAYHHQTRQINGPLIETAYAAAMKAGLYASVAHADGRPPRRAYAATNPQEYFAELTEAYFGRNDFAPFDREALLRHDPGGFALMREIWGEPGNPAKPLP